ncbi:putative thiol-disulfide oxidoreductase DCC protein [Senna tora]|uniref:Putative thiol-disulfide oxidoreductase DCC protein n=1 Tax=Senna tora TaxID=362788 RepID=A0A834WN09_9FABA|nr:putative thiol-disulfide oxidoreductase DCC protein [Senna tora]
MKCLSHLSSYTAAIFTRTTYFLTNPSLHGCSTFSWKRQLEYPAIRSVHLDFVLTRFRVQCYSSRKGRKPASKLQKLDPEPVMEQEKNAFFVVRKGDIVGIYNTLSDCQAQVGSSISNPPVSVYKGYSLPKDTEEYLVARGLKNALYTIRAADLKEDMFDTLVPCPFQDPASSSTGTSNKDVSKKRSLGVLGQENLEDGTGLTSLSEDPMRKQVKLEHTSVPQAPSSELRTCILEFDGASKGNPGIAGAGAILRASDGSLIDGLWKVKNQNMSDLYKVAKELKDKFLSFQITHVLRMLRRGFPNFKLTATTFRRLLSSMSSPLPLRSSSISASRVSDSDDDENLDSSLSSVVHPVGTVPSLLQPRVVVYDGVCHLCHRGVKWVIKADKNRKIKFCCVQSKAAEPYLNACGLEQEDVLHRFLFVEGLNSYSQGSTAALRVMSYLPLPYSALSSLLVVPRPVRDAVYDYIAKHRYKWFGKAEDCLVLQEKELLDRFVDWEELNGR